MIPHESLICLQSDEAYVASLVEVHAIVNLVLVLALGDEKERPRIAVRSRGRWVGEPRLGAHQDRDGDEGDDSSTSCVRTSRGQFCSFIEDSRSRRRLTTLRGRFRVRVVVGEESLVVAPPPTCEPPNKTS